MIKSNLLKATVFNSNDHTIVFHQQIFLGEEKNKMAARDAIGSRTSLAVSRGITRCVGSFYYAENKLQILVLFTSLVVGTQ